MTLETIYNMLQETGLDVCYDHAETGQKLPYICYRADGSNNFHADNKVYKKIESLEIILYTRRKDIASERKLESIFGENDIPWEKMEIYLSDEKCYQIIYSIGGSIDD